MSIFTPLAALDPVVERHQVEVAVGRRFYTRMAAYDPIVALNETAAATGAVFDARSIYDPACARHAVDVALSGGGGGGGPPPPSWTIIGHTSANSAGTTAAIDTTGANLLVFGVSYLHDHAGDAVPIDSKGNTWTAIASPVGDSSRDFAQFYYVANPTVGSGHTFHTPGNAIGSFCILAASGANSSPLDQNNGTVYPGDDGIKTFHTGSITPSVANELFVAFMSVDDGFGNVPMGPFSIDSGFTVIETQDVQVGVAFGGVLAYAIKAGGPTAVNPAFTSTVALQGGRRLSAIIASFKQAA